MGSEGGLASRGSARPATMGLSCSGWGSASTRSGWPDSRIVCAQLKPKRPGGCILDKIGILTCQDKCRRCPPVHAAAQRGPEGFYLDLPPRNPLRLGAPAVSWRAGHQCRFGASPGKLIRCAACRVSASLSRLEILERSQQLRTHALILAERRDEC